MTITPHDIKEKLLHFITENFMVDLEGIDLNDSLIDQGIIDSRTFEKIDLLI